MADDEINVDEATAQAEAELSGRLKGIARDEKLAQQRARERAAEQEKARHENRAPEPVLCVDCDQPILSKRLATGAETCIDCQEKREETASHNNYSRAARFESRS